MFSKESDKPPRVEEHGARGPFAGLKKLFGRSETTAAAPVEAAKPLKLSSGVVTPKAGLTVTGRPTYSSVLTFERKLKDTKFKFVLADVTVDRLRSAQGYLVSAERTDGSINTRLTHDFGSGESKLLVGATQTRDNKKLKLEYLGSSSKPAGGIVGSTVEVTQVDRKHKLAAGYNLGSQLATLDYTLDAGELSYSAAVNSKQMLRLNASRQRDGHKFTATYVFPVLVGAEWQNKPFKVTAVAPITQEGLGDVKLTALVEKTISI